MSIRMRLILALGALLAATIIAMIAALLFDSRDRVRDEVTSSMRVTETLLRSSLGSLEGASDVRSRVEALVQSLQNLRHVEVALASSKSAVAVKRDDRHPPDVRFTLVEEPEFETVVVPVVVAGRQADAIIITAQAGDEMNEVWETIARISLYALGLAAAAFILTSLLINRALSPVHDLGRALHLLEEGDYNIAVPQSGAPEIAAIGVQVNALAGTLRKARDENRSLSTAIVRAQDDERQDVARELHDELGPHLFAMRASSAALVRALEQDKTESGRAVAHAHDVQEQVDALQKTNRRVLQQLSPIGLDELGLTRAIAAIVSVWRRQQPDCEIVLNACGGLDALDRTVALTVYRMAQEGLTNAFRHAGASRIEIDIERREPAPDDSAPASIRIEIRDNGVGLAEEAEDGFGLRGMRERIGALGGSLSVLTPDEGGTTLQASLPAAERPGAAAG